MTPFLLYPRTKGIRILTIKSLGKRRLELSSGLERLRSKSDIKLELIPLTKDKYAH